MIVCIKRSLKCPFGLDALGKIKLNSKRISHQQSSGASLWGGYWKSKLLVVIGIACMGVALKSDTSSWRNVLGLSVHRKVYRELDASGLPVHCTVGDRLTNRSVNEQIG
ncbi:hypothetical protein TNCV_4913191 [Trichonephila clavipes]|nr:hypothetical protein TNCV_4913191 [Trichonephila clavipes]